MFARSRANRAARLTPFRQICETIVNRSTPLGIRESGQAASPHSTESPGRHRVFKSPLSPQESETMFRNASYQSCLKFIAITMLVAGLTAAQALTPAGAKRPASVPADYLITPFGYFHPSCVHQLAKGESVRKDARAIQHADGSLQAVNTCAYAQYNSKGEVAAQ